MIRVRVGVAMGDAARQVARVAGLSPAAGLDEASAMLVRVAQVYPPAPAGSTYRRTETLRGGWEPIGPMATAAQGYGGAVNEVDYAEYVMGDRQAAVHQGRWRTVDEIGDAQEAAVVALVEAAVDRRIGGP